MTFNSFPEKRVHKMCSSIFSTTCIRTGNRSSLPRTKRQWTCRTSNNDCSRVLNGGFQQNCSSPTTKREFPSLKNKLYRDGVNISDDIIEYVAKNIKTNVRELEGAIISLIAQSSFNKVEITQELAQDVVMKFVKNTKREVSIDYIQKVVSDYFQMDVETLQSKTRRRHIVQARQLAMYFAKKFTKASLASIGNQIGKRDHATVLTRMQNSG